MEKNEAVKRQIKATMVRVEILKAKLNDQQEEEAKAKVEHELALAEIILKELYAQKALDDLNESVKKMRKVKNKKKKIDLSFAKPAIIAITGMTILGALSQNDTTRYL